MGAAETARPAAPPTGRPVILDAFSGAGGAAVGYHRAGFDVVGVDIHPQPRYPFAFEQGDAIEFIRRHGRGFDAIHSSPPCQFATRLRSIHKREYPNLIPATRHALRAAGRPYVIENVPGSGLIEPVMLCGASFGLRVYRHRLFECSFFLLVPPHERHRVPTIQRGYRRDWAGFVTVAGGHNVPKALAAGAMGIDWMSRAELSQSIPPVYTRLIGAQLLRALGRAS